MDSILRPSDEYANVSHLLESRKISLNEINPSLFPVENVNHLQYPFNKYCMSGFSNAKQVKAT